MENPQDQAQEAKSIRINYAKSVNQNPEIEFNVTEDHIIFSDKEDDEPRYNRFKAYFAMTSSDPDDPNLPEMPPLTDSDHSYSANSDEDLSVEELEVHEESHSEEQVSTSRVSGNP